MFNGMAELTLTIFRLPVFYKQRDFRFYPAWAFALPIWVLRIPLSFLESGIWVVLTYYTIGFAPAASRWSKYHRFTLLVFLFYNPRRRPLFDTADDVPSFCFRFFRQFLAFFGIHQMALALFRFLAAVGRIEVVANTLGTFTLLVVFVLGGFIVARSKTLNSV